MAGNTYCARCGEALVPGAKFCGRCGEPVAPRPLSTPLPATRTVRPRQLPTQGVLIVIGAVLLLVIVALVGATLLGRQAGGREPAADAPAPTADMSESETVEPDADTSASATSPTRCWNGEERESPQACPPPRGVAGMRWLFPSLARSFGKCDSAPAYGGKLRAFECPVSEPGRSARVFYSEWGTFELGDGHYRRKYGAPDRTDSQFNVWSTTWVSNSFQTSRMFARGLPYSVTVAATNRMAATEVMNGLRFRSATETDPYRQQ